MIKTILIIAFVLVAALLAYAATKPDTFHVRRSTSINAPPEKIFPLIRLSPLTDCRIPGCPVKKAITTPVASRWNLFVF